MSLLQRLVVIFLCANTVACGFSLRGSQALPEELSDIAINASTQFAPLARTLSDRLPVYQLNGSLIDSSSQINSPRSATVLIKMQPERLERRLLSLFSSGQVAEYELIYSVDYEVTFPDREMINHTLTVAREYQ
ncbi:MAG: LPS assembly lipoprotein LptE, partial [Pseudomonadota bacterium]